MSDGLFASGSLRDEVYIYPGTNFFASHRIVESVTLGLISVICIVVILLSIRSCS